MSWPSDTLVCLLHGGFWRAPHGPEQLQPLAVALGRRGHAVCNLGYTRVGDPDFSWRRMLEDVAQGIQRALGTGTSGRAPRNVAIVGHSAGAQLAIAGLGAVQRTAAALLAGRNVYAISLGGILDLEMAFDDGLGRSAVQELLGGRPSSRPELYEQACPTRLLPAPRKVKVVRAGEDNTVPEKYATTYCHRAAATGAQVQLACVAGAGHMDLIGPHGECFDRLVQLLGEA